MRFRLPEIFLGCCLKIAVFAMGTVFSSSMTSPNSGPKSSTNSSSKQEATQISADERIANYTWWLAILTGALVLAVVGQGYFIVRSDKTARIAANAADLSARAAIGLELPIIRMTPDSLGSGAVRDGDQMTVSYSVGSVVFANFGRTKAFPIEAKCGMTLGDSLAAEPTYSSVETFLPNIAFEPPPPKPDIHTTPRLRLSSCSVVVQNNDGDKIRRGEMNLWFYCSLVYNDFMDTRREVGACWRWTNVGLGMGWRPDATPAYNRKS